MFVSGEVVGDEEALDDDRGEVGEYFALARFRAFSTSSKLGFEFCFIDLLDLFE
jgi:hypothetical protein